METRIDFFDEDGNNISELVKTTKVRSSPWHTSGVFTYSHGLLGDIDIGAFSGGSISTNDGYTYTSTGE